MLKVVTYCRFLQVQAWKVFIRELFIILEYLYLHWISRTTTFNCTTRIVNKISIYLSRCVCASFIGRDVMTRPRESTHTTEIPKQSTRRANSPSMTSTFGDQSITTITLERFQNYTEVILQETFKIIETVLHTRCRYRNYRSLHCLSLVNALSPPRFRSSRAFVWHHWVLGHDDD